MEGHLEANWAYMTKFPSFHQTVCDVNFNFFLDYPEISQVADSCRKILT
jgi:hypothetical protein